MKYLMTLFKFCFSIVLLMAIAFPQDRANLQVGDPAPTFYLRTLEGENFFLSKAVESDSPIILSFYATWCIPCRQEIPALEKMMTDPELKNVRLYYVNVGSLMAAEDGGEVKKQREETDKVYRHKEKFHMTHPILMDRYAMTAQKYGARSLPSLVVVGGDGRLKYIHHGYKPGDEEALLALLKTL
ncbi:MAG: TlpA family protein disulfide reductase [Bacteroidetes bacterium]|jgi:thiol-disulfide isomerase/thioredoxin|nr:TlpA family protein disulfide reductase [Bacteroidota bacterium]